METASPDADLDKSQRSAFRTARKSAALLLKRDGARVAVLEARSVGAVTTGNTTAKLSLLQGTTLSEIRRHHSDEVLC